MDEENRSPLSLVLARVSLVVSLLALLISGADFVSHRSLSYEVRALSENYELVRAEQSKFSTYLDTKIATGFTTKETVGWAKEVFDTWMDSYEQDLRDGASFDSIDARMFDYLNHLKKAGTRFGVSAGEVDLRISRLEGFLQKTDLLDEMSRRNLVILKSPVLSSLRSANRPPITSTKRATSN